MFNFWADEELFVFVIARAIVREIAFEMRFFRERSILNQEGIISKDFLFKRKKIASNSICASISVRKGPSRHLLWVAFWIGRYKSIKHVVYTPSRKNGQKQAFCDDLRWFGLILRRFKVWFLSPIFYDFCGTSELVGSAQNLACPGTPRAEFLRLRVFWCDLKAGEVSFWKAFRSFQSIKRRRRRARL